MSSLHLTLVLLVACGGMVDAPALQTSLVDAKQQLQTPSGTLRTADPVALTYTVLAAARLIDVLKAPASRLPGLRQSALFKGADAGMCAEGMPLELSCVGKAGSVDVKAKGDYTTDNGDYGVLLRDTDAVSGDLFLHVQGLANGVVEDEALISFALRIAGAPDRYAHVAGSSLIVTIDPQGGTVKGVASINNMTFAFSDFALSGDALVFLARDARDEWRCDTRARDGSATGNCRTKQGDGNWSVLEF